MHAVKGITKNNDKKTSIKDKGFRVDDAFSTDTNSRTPFHETNLSTDDEGRNNQDLSTNRTSSEQFPDSQNPLKKSNRKK